VNSTAAVNINCSVRENIENGIKNPKIGIFDEIIRKKNYIINYYLS